MKPDCSHTLLFIHVPKTAGTTIDSVLHRQFPAEQIYTVRKDIQGSYKAYVEMDPGKRAHFRVVKGHIPFGVHEHVPGPYAYFTFLREPIDRTISHYYFLRRKTTHPLSDKLGEYGLSLKEILELELDKMMFNAHTRLLSGAWYEPMPGKCTREHLEQAKENLRKNFSVVGLTERFDESLILLKRAYDWRDIRYSSWNVTHGRPTKDELPAETRAVVESANLMDTELYTYGQELFAEQVAGIERQLAFEVGRLRLANYLERWTMPIKQRSVRVYIRERWLKRANSGNTTVSNGGQYVDD